MTAENEPDERWRARARRALEGYFERRSAPRLILTAIVIITGAAGFAVSVVLLHLGLQAMWARYPLALLTAYGVFLGLIRLWVELEKSRFRPERNEIEEALKEEDSFNLPWTSSQPRKSSWFDWLDVTNLFDFDEGCIPVLLLAAIAGVIAVIAFVVLSAPALVAEVFLDAFVVTVLYRRLQLAAREHWLGTAVRKTIWRAIIAAALLSLAGWILELLAPGAHSIGPALQQIANGYRAA